MAKLSVCNWLSNLQRNRHCKNEDTTSDWPDCIRPLIIEKQQFSRVSLLFYQFYCVQIFIVMCFIKMQTMHCEKSIWTKPWDLPACISWCLFPLSMGLSIVYFKGSQLRFSKLWFIPVPEGCFNHNKQWRLLKCSIIRLHFIWIFTVCQSTRLGVSKLQIWKILQYTAMRTYQAGLGVYHLAWTFVYFHAKDMRAAIYLFFFFYYKIIRYNFQIEPAHTRDGSGESAETRLASRL